MLRAAAFLPSRKMLRGRGVGGRATLLLLRMVGRTMVKIRTTILVISDNNLEGETQLLYEAAVANNLLKTAVDIRHCR